MKVVFNSPLRNLIYDDSITHDLVITHCTSRPEAFWDEFLLKVYDEHINSESVVLEVGAHVGTHSCYIAKRCKTIYVIEPQKYSYLNLCANLYLNDCWNSVPIHTVCLDKENVLMAPKVYTSENDWKNSQEKASATFYETENADSFLSIRSKTIDSLNIPKVDFIKTDCEGNDIKVLTGGIETIKRDRPKIVFELPKGELYIIEEILKPYNYSFEEISSSNFLALPK